jgi:ABC-type branched-subunit amino acid transport system permease subunit
MIVIVVKVVLVMALLVFAALISSPKGRLPLALRGLKKIINSDFGINDAQNDQSQRVSAKRRFLAFILVILAIAIAIST